MKRAWRWWWLAGLLALAVAAGMADGGGVAAGSVLTRGPSGWFGLHGVLASWSVPTVVLDRPLDDLEVAPVLEGEAGCAPTMVVSFPLQRTIGRAEVEAIKRHVRTGATLVVAYSGQPLDLREASFLETLGLDRSEATPVPLIPWQWPKARRAVWTLTPVAAGLTDARPLEIAAPRAWPIAPDAATVLYRGGPAGDATVFSLPVDRGRVVVLPADAWSNARLGTPGNADLLATLVADVASPWVFSEFHHGLTDLELAAQRRAEAVVIDLGWLQLTFLDLLIAHLVALYGLGLVALGRPFGTPWRAPAVVSGSTGAFLRGLGTLHDRLGHHGEVARRLASRVGRAHAAWRATERASTVHDGPGLVRFARALHAEVGHASLEPLPIPRSDSKEQA